jgi:hypothetical protein
MTPARSPNRPRDSEILAIMAKLAEVRRSIRECPRNPSGSPTWAAMDDMATDYVVMGLLELQLERARAHTDPPTQQQARKPNDR